MRTLLAVALVVLAGCSGDAGPVEGPSTAVFVVDDRARVIEIDPSDGRELREVATGAETDLYPGLTATSAAVYVVRPHSLNERRIVRIDLADGAESEVGLGVYPRANGDRLAFVATDTATGVPSSVVVRDGGDERRWTLETADDFIVSLAWTADGERLMCLVDGDAGSRVFEIDPAQAGAFEEPVATAPADEIWTAVAASRTSTLVSTTCCDPDFTGPWTVATTAGGQASHDLDGPATGVAVEPVSDALLVLKDGTLFRVDDGDLRAIRDGVVAVSG